MNFQNIKNYLRNMVYHEKMKGREKHNECRIFPIGEFVP